jgi:hypothetical protein
LVPILTLELILPGLRAGEGLHWTETTKPAIGKQGRAAPAVLKDTTLE